MPLPCTNLAELTDGAVEILGVIGDGNNYFCIVELGIQVVQERRRRISRVVVQELLGRLQHAQESFKAIAGGSCACFLLFGDTLRVCDSRFNGFCCHLPQYRVLLHEWLL